MALGILVMDGSLSGAEARLVRRGDKGLIRVSDRIREPGRRRFAIAHELGHWSEHRHASQLSLCLDSEVIAYQGSFDELEANAFAANLLMPGKFLRDTYTAAPSFDLIQTISHELQTTLTASAVRVVETTLDSCFVVFSDIATRQVKWWRRSGRCPEIWLEGKQTISELSAVHDICTKNQFSSASEEVNPRAWFSHLSECDKLVVVEESMRLGSYPIAISLLSVASD